MAKRCELIEAVDNKGGERCTTVTLLCHRYSMSIPCCCFLSPNKMRLNGMISYSACQSNFLSSSKLALFGISTFPFT